MESRTIAPPADGTLRYDSTLGVKLDTLTAIGVARQSRSSDDTKSVPDQVEAIGVGCTRNGFDLLDVYEEIDVSGQRPLARRKGLLRAVEAIEAGRAQVLVVAYFDRLVRSTKTQVEVLERVEAAGGRVLALDVGEVSTESAAKWLNSQMLGMFAEYYARSVSERTAEAKARNIRLGIPPFGRVTPAYEKIKEGPDKGKLRKTIYAPLIAEAARMRADGVSYTRLQRFLADNGLTMTLSAIEGMLSSRLLLGEIHFGSFPPNLAAHEPVIDHVTFDRIQKAKATRGRYGKSDRLLARLGVLRCETCDARMTVVSTKSNGKRYPYYRCGNTLCEKPAIIAANVAETTVRDEAIRLANDRVGRASNRDDVEAARLARDDAERALDAAIRTLASLGGEAATIEVLDALRSKRDEAVARHDRLLALAAPDLTIRTSSDWDVLSADERRGVIRAVIDRAVVAPGRGPDRVVVVPRLAQ